MGNSNANTPPTQEMDSITTTILRPTILLPPDPPPIMLLKLYICLHDNDELVTKYTNHVAKHNAAIKSMFFDSGFDLFSPTFFTIGRDEDVVKYNLEIRAAAFDSVSMDPMPFYVYPRSSIYKTPLRLANSVGIIDTGYRGNLCALFDKKPNATPYTINEGSRLLQICAPDLRRVHVQLVSSPEDLGHTDRGQGGFGSTGGTN